MLCTKYLWVDYLLSDILATLQVMITIREDLRLHNRNNTVLGDVTKFRFKAYSHIHIDTLPECVTVPSSGLKSPNDFHLADFTTLIFKLTKWHAMTSHTNLLADACISGQYISILKDGQLRRRGFADLQHTAPLGEVCPILLVLRTALGQPVQTYTPDTYTELCIRNTAEVL